MDFLRFALQYAYSRRKAAAYIALCFLVWMIIFYVNSLPVNFLSYLILFSLAPVLFFEIRRLLYVYQKRLTLGDMTEVSAKTLDELAAQYPPEESFEDEDYQKLLRRYVEASENHEEDAAPDSAAFAQYYTRWAREIKEPVGAMQQLLLTGDSPLVRRMSVELRHMEQYAEMAAAYARLEAGPEYALKKYDLSAIVQKSVRKFNGESIEKRLPVTFDPAPVMAVTDGKWFSLALEQILSNAFRYAFSGGITITVEKEAGAAEDMEDWTSVSAGPAPGVGPFLSVRDEGVGISPDALEHLLDRDSPPENGLGLYLCRRICDDLGHSISVTSKEGEGTLVRLELSMGLAAPDDAEEKSAEAHLEEAKTPTERTDVLPSG